MNTVNFEGWTFKEITLQLLLIGILSVCQVIEFRLEFRKRLFNINPN
jgi:hypothetical protein